MASAAEPAAVLRTAQGLLTLAIRAVAPAVPERDPRRDRELPGQSTFALALEPLRPGAHPRLEAAWSALARVDALTPGTLLSALAVLVATCPAGPPPRGLPAFAPPAPPPPPRATAAHPRAFRGTRHQPPTPPAPRALDVRPYLLDARTTQQLLAALRPHLASARRAPEVSPAALDAVRAGLDPYLAAHHGLTAAADARLALPPHFAAELLPFLRGASRATLARAVARVRELAGAPADPARAGLAALARAAGDPARFVAWCDALALVPPARRARVVALALETGAAARVDPAAALEPAWFARFAAEAPEDEPRFAWRAASLLAGLAAGASPGYLATGFALSARFDPDAPDPLGPAPPPGRACPAPAVLALTERLAAELRGDGGAHFWALHLWRACGEQPGFDAVLEAPYWRALAPRAAFWLLRLATSANWHDAAALTTWERVRAVLPALAAAASELPSDYQYKFVADAAGVCWRALDAAPPCDPAPALARLAPLFLRTARAPFATAPCTADAVRALARGADASARAALCAAPDRCWTALERACRRENDARLVAAGLAALVARAPAFARAAFEREPGRLAETARALGALAHAAAASAVDAAMAGPTGAALFDPAAGALPVERLFRLLSEARVAGGTNPVPRALREHLDGARALTPHQLARVRGVMAAGLDLVRLERVEHAALAALAAPLSRELDGGARARLVREPGARHALAVLANADENRRALRRLLRAHWRGEADWRLRHPATRAWLARHPRLRTAAWLGPGEGVAHAVALAEGDGRTATLALERDPLEALRLGTYVGSCLGVGGSFTYSAAAVVLDVNKQVVYARDAGGAVLARQLVAVSEEDTLVAFEVYPDSTPAPLREAFHAFDQALADAIGLPLRARGADYTVVSVLSHDFWDDGAP